MSSPSSSSSPSSRSAAQEAGSDISSSQMYASPSGQQSTPQNADGGSQVSNSSYTKSKRDAKSEWAALSLSNSNNFVCNIMFGETSTKPTKRGWIKIRGVMKQWTIRLFDLRPPYLIYFKDEDDEMRDDAVGIIDLKGCKVSERESKKDGFCFKISSLTSSTIYMSRGLKNEILATKLAPMNTSIAILRVVTREEGLEWIAAINSAIEYANTFNEASAPVPVPDRSSSQSVITSPPSPMPMPEQPKKPAPRPPSMSAASSSSSIVIVDKKAAVEEEDDDDVVDDDDMEKPMTPQQIDVSQKLSPSSSPKSPSKSPRRVESKKKVTSPAAPAVIPLEKLISYQGLKALDPVPSNYEVEIPREEMKVDAFEQGKNIILQLLKQVKPGMDLTKITLPTHILEPRSFLEKMTDYFAHIELISQ